MKSAILIIFVLFSLSSYSQFNLMDQNSLSIASGKKLMVVLKSEADFDENADTDKNSKYHNFIENYNAAMKSALPKYWNFTKGEISFKTEDEINKMSIEEQKQYLYIHSGWVYKHGAQQGTLIFFSFNFDFLKDNSERENLFEIAYLPDSIFTGADAIFISKIFNNHVRYTLSGVEKLKDAHNIDSCIEIIRTRTLLINKAQSEIRQENLAKTYDYKAELVDPARIQSEIEKESESYLFVRLIYSPNTHMAMWDAFDTKTCTVIASDGTGGVSIEIKEQQRGFRTDKLTGKYGYFKNPWYSDKTELTLFRSSYTINKTAIKYFDSKFAQKINYR